MDMARRTRATKQESKPLPKGMKIQLKGLLTIPEAIAGFHQAMDQLQAQRIKKMRGTNVYLTPADENGNAVVRISRGQKIQDIVIVEPYRSPAEEHAL
jgi:hypothetical protein